MSTPRTLALLTSALVLSLSAACTTPPEKKQAAAETKSDEYVNHTSLGSHIPVRVKKSQVKTSETESEQSREALAEAQRMGTTLPAGAR